MHIDDILRRKGNSVCTIDHGQPLSEATRRMHEQRIGAVVVLNGQGAPAGIVSQSEILAALHDLGQSTLGHCATGVMRKPVPACTTATKVQDAMAQMTRERARHLVVMDDAGAMAGIVSMGDLVAARLSAAELESNTLRDMARCHIMAEAATG